METYFKHSIAVNVHFKRFVKSFLSLPQGAKHDTPLMCKLLLRAYASTPNTLKFVAKNVEDYAAKLNEWGQNVERFVENCLEHYDLNIASLIENDRSQAMSDAISAILQRDAKLEEAVDISRRLMSFAAAAAGLVTSSMRDTRDQTTKLEELMKDDDLKIPDDILNRFKKQTKRYKWTNVFYHDVVTSKWEGTDYSLKYEDGAIVAVGEGDLVDPPDTWEVTRFDMAGPDFSTNITDKELSTKIGKRLVDDKHITIVKYDKRDFSHHWEGADKRVLKEISHWDDLSQYILLQVLSKLQNFNYAPDFKEKCIKGILGEPSKD